MRLKQVILFILFYFNRETPYYGENCAQLDTDQIRGIFP